MSEQVQEQPAGRNPFARLIGVITSPTETFEEIARHPGWVAPFLIYLAVLVVALGVYSMKADWVAIVTEQIENFPLMAMAPEQAREEAIKESTAAFKKLTPAQIATQTAVQAAGVTLSAYHFCTVFYCTLFVLMGSPTGLRLGKAWVNFLLCLLTGVGFIVVYSISNFAFEDSPGSAILLNSAAALVMIGGWMWLLNRHALSDPEFHKMLSVYVHATAAVAILGALALLATSVATAPPITTPAEKIVPSSLAAVVKPDVPVLRKLFEWLDAFWIAWVALLAIGFRVVTKLSMGVVLSLTLLIPGVMMLISLAMAAVFG